MKAVPASFLAAILAAAPVLAAETAGTTTQTPPAATAPAKPAKTPASEPQKVAASKKPTKHHAHHARRTHKAPAHTAAPDTTASPGK